MLQSGRSTGGGLRAAWFMLQTPVLTCAGWLDVSDEAGGGQGRHHNIITFQPRAGAVMGKETKVVLW